MPTLFSKLACFFFFFNVCADTEFLRPRLPLLKTRTHTEVTINKHLTISEIKVEKQITLRLRADRTRGYICSVFPS